MPGEWQPGRVHAQGLKVFRWGAVEVVDDEAHFIEGHLPDHERHGDIIPLKLPTAAGPLTDPSTGRAAVAAEPRSRRHAFRVSRPKAASVALLKLCDFGWCAG